MNSTISRRSILRHMSAASGGLAIGIPKLSIRADAIPTKISHSQSKFGVITVELGEKPTNSVEIKGGMDWPLYSVVEDETGRRAVYVSQKSGSGLSLSGAFDDLIVATVEGYKQVSGSGKIAFKRLYTHANPLGSVGFLEGIEGPRIAVSTANSGLQVRVDDREVSLDPRQNQKLVLPHTVGSGGGAIDTELVVQSSYHGEVDVFEHRDGILLPKTDDNKPFFDMIRSPRNNRYGRQFDQLTLEEHDEINAVALVPNAENKGGGAQ